MPTTRAGATAAQTQGQLDDENVLEHVLQMIMGFPTDSEAAQALDDAGIKSVKDLLMLDGEMFAQLTFKAGTDEKKLRFLMSQTSGTSSLFTLHCVSAISSSGYRTTTGTTSPTTTEMNLCEPSSFPRGKRAYNYYNGVSYNTNREIGISNYSP